MSLNVLLISDEMLKERTGVHGNIDPKLLRPEIKVAQDMYIHPILGTALYEKLISDINVSGTTAGDYKILLDDYILDTLINYVLSELPEAISYQFWNKGVTRKGGTDTELPDISDLIQISNRYRRRAEWYGERLARYLRETATNSVLPEYLDQNSRTDALTPEQSAYSLPLNIDVDWDVPVSKDKNNCRCDE